MILFANFLQGIGTVLDMVLSIMIFVLIARAVISWVNPDPYNPIVRFLTSSTDPMLRPLRKYIPLVGGGIDLTPIALLIVFYFLKVFLVQTLLDYSVQMKRNMPGVAWQKHPLSICQISEQFPCRRMLT